MEWILGKKTSEHIGGEGEGRGRIDIGQNIPNGAYLKKPIWLKLDIGHNKSTIGMFYLMSNSSPSSNQICSVQYSLQPHAAGQTLDKT